MPACCHEHRGPNRRVDDELCGNANNLGVMLQAKRYYLLINRSFSCTDHHTGRHLASLLCRELQQFRGAMGAAPQFLDPYVDVRSAYNFGRHLKTLKGLRAPVN